MNILQIIIIIVIVVLVIMLLKYILSDPYTLQYMKNGQTANTIAATSLATNGSSVPSSNFAYSIWFYVNDWNYRYGERKVLFGRMSSGSPVGTGDVSGLNGLGPCPAVYFDSVENNILVSLSCYPGADTLSQANKRHAIIKTCSVNNVPIQKWVNLVVSVYGRSMDLYIDGKLVRTCLLPGIANINVNSNVYVTPSGGFNGWTSRFQYFPSSLNPQDVWNIYAQGYASSLWGNFLNTYQLTLSLVKNGDTETSVTI